MRLKRPLSYEEQVEQLMAHGMSIENKDEAIEFLNQVNYYRFTGYALQNRIKKDESTYEDGTTFTNIKKIYEADEAIRNVCRKYLEKIEIYYRNKISYGFTTRKCITEPFDQHYQRENYYNKEGYDSVIENFKREQQYYKDSLIVKHHKNNYDGKMPLWVMVELMSFSNLSKLYHSMYDSEKNAIAHSVGTGPRTLENHLHCMSVLRNKCAHGARLYNTTMNPPAVFTKKFLQKNPEIQNNTLFAYILVLLKKIPDEHSKELFIDEIENIIIEYNVYIDLKLIGFPHSYLDIMKRF